MKFVIVDGDREALEYTQQSLKCVYEEADIETFSDALSTYKYCVNHSNEIAQVFISVVLKPIDGFKLRELICTLPIPLGIVLTMREQSNELIELIEADGNGRYIVKPVTPSKIRELANKTVDGCNSDKAECKVNSHFWCNIWNGQINA